MTNVQREAIRKQLKHVLSTGITYYGYRWVERQQDSIDRALAVRSHPGVWRAMQHNAMSTDFSWRNSVAVYMRMYRSLVPAARFLRPAMAIVNESVPVRRASASKTRTPISRKPLGSRAARNGGGIVPDSAAA